MAMAQESEPRSGEVVARIRDSGRSLRYADGAFWLESVGEVGPQFLQDRDRIDDLVWVDDETRGWFLSRFSPELAATPSAGMTARASDALLAAADKDPRGLSQIAGSAGLGLGLAAIAFPDPFGGFLVLGAFTCGMVALSLERKGLGTLALIFSLVGLARYLVVLYEAGAY